METDTKTKLLAEMFSKFFMTSFVHFGLNNYPGYIMKDFFKDLHKWIENNPGYFTDQSLIKIVKHQMEVYKKC